MSNDTPPADGPRKRVVFKVWRENGVVCDNAHEITYLERSGWQVRCAEKLLDDPASGTCSVLYVLGEAPAGAPGQSEAADQPVVTGTEGGAGGAAADAPKPKLKEEEFAQVSFPSTAAQATFVCRATRGRIVLRSISPQGNDLAVSGPATAGSIPTAAAGLVSVRLYDDKAQQPIRFVRMAALCVNDSSPDLPPAKSSSQHVLPDAPPAQMRVHAFYTSDDRQAPNPDQIDLLIDTDVPGGQAKAFYFELSRKGV